MLWRGKHFLWPSFILLGSSKKPGCSTARTANACSSPRKAFSVLRSLSSSDFSVTHTEKKKHYSAHLTCGVESVHFTLTFKTSWDFAHTSKPSKWKIIPQFLCRVCIDVTVATATIQPRHHDSLPPLTIYKPILLPFPLHLCFKVQHENRST